jgi:hypothetical protein
LPSALALGAAALGGGALGYFAGNRSAASGMSASAPGGGEQEPSLWSQLANSSSRIARGWNAWRGSSPGSEMPALGDPGGDSSSLGNAISEPIDAEIDGPQTIEIDYPTAEIVEPPFPAGDASLGSQMGGNINGAGGWFGGGATAEPGVETTDIEHDGGWFGGSEPEPVDASIEDDCGWFGGGDAGGLDAGGLDAGGDFDLGGLDGGGFEF